MAVIGGNRKPDVIEVSRDGTDRVILKFGGVVLDVNTTRIPGDPGLVVEAYAFQTGKRVEREDWAQGRYGILSPGQVATYRVVEDR